MRVQHLLWLTFRLSPQQTELQPKERGRYNFSGVGKACVNPTAKKVIQERQLMMEESNQVRDSSVTQWRPLLDCQPVVSIVLMIFTEMVTESFRSHGSDSGSESWRGWFALILDPPLAALFLGRVPEKSLLI